VANIKSQIKRNRQSDKKRLRNRVYRGEARIAVKNARNTIEEGNPESKESVQQAISALDKAAEQGVIHKNNAARRKSRLVKALAKMEPVMVAEPADVEAIVEIEPAKKKGAVRKTTAKKTEEPKVEVTEATKKTTSTKKSATKQAVAKKTAAKKTDVKKTTEKKATTPKKSTTKKQS
jgi:small subunit ribosomal protein S20